MSILAGSLKPAHLRPSVFTRTQKNHCEAISDSGPSINGISPSLCLALYLTAAWEHEFNYSGLPITAGLADILDPNETLVSPVEGQDSAVVTTGLSVQWTPMISTYVRYGGARTVYFERGHRWRESELVSDLAGNSYRSDQRISIAGISG